MATLTPETPDDGDSSSTVDASRPFHSVKEAVAIFGKRILLGEIQSPLKQQIPVIEKITSPPYNNEVTPSPKKPPTCVSGKVTSPSNDEFTRNPSNELASLTYELKLSPEKSPSSAFTTNSEKTPSWVVTENGMSDSSEFTTPTSEKTPSCVVVHDNGISDSSEFTQSPNKRSLGNTSKEVVSAYHEPATPSPVNRNKSYPTPSFSWEKGVSAPQTPSISSSKEVESSPIHGNPNHGKTVHGNDLVMMLMILKRLESELEETKKELKLLKERESETEVALASLNAELHKNMSKIARAEATEAAKAAAKSGTLLHDGNQEMDSKSKDHQERNGYHDEVMIKHVDSPTLAQILSITDYDCYFENSNKLKKKMKKKPIIPLLTDLLPWWKRSQSPSRYQSAPLFSSH